MNRLSARKSLRINRGDSRLLGARNQIAVNRLDLITKIAAQGRGFRTRSPVAELGPSRSFTSLSFAASLKLVLLFVPLKISLSTDPKQTQTS